MSLLAYLAIRMPATFAAVYKSLEQCRQMAPKRLLDLGAGPGTASWAAAALFPSLEEIILVEASPQMAALGERLASASALAPLRSAAWLCQSIAEQIPSADLVLLSYLIGEISSSQCEDLLERLWLSEATVIAIIEPGTPAGYQRIMRARSWALEQGAAIIAPCPHSLDCPMKSPNWCHFPARVERTRLHRELKSGSLGYEDEKFSYLVLSKQPIVGRQARIVGPPHKASGFVTLPLCIEGRLEERTVTRKSSDYKEARHAEWGDGWYS
jgi:ribosomal protein RSM22 (predicted rRNA methylase)